MSVCGHSEAAGRDAFRDGLVSVSEGEVLREVVLVVKNTPLVFGGSHWR